MSTSVPSSWEYRISNTALLNVPGPMGIKYRYSRPFMYEIIKNSTNAEKKAEFEGIYKYKSVSTPAV